MKLISIRSHGFKSFADKIEININKADEDKSREELLEELKLARIENEYLKKLSALVQERKAQEQKKK